MAFREAAGPLAPETRRARPGPVCSGRKPSGRGRRARAEAASMLTTIAAATDPAPTKMTAIARATGTTTAAAVRTAADAKARAALEGGEAARDRWQGPEGGREQLDEQRGEWLRKGGRRWWGGQEGARQGPLQRAINSSKAWKHYLVHQLQQIDVEMNVELMFPRDVVTSREVSYQG